MLQSMWSQRVRHNLAINSSNSKSLKAFIKPVTGPFEAGGGGK